MADQQQFAIVPVPAHPGLVRDYITSEAPVIGPWAEAMWAVQDSVSHTSMLRRLDEGQRQAVATERKQLENRTRQILTFCDSVNKLSRRIANYEAEMAIRKQRAADEAEREKQERIQSELDALPDPDDPHSWGELTPHPASQPEDIEQVKAGEDDAETDPDPVKDAGQGDLPTELTEQIPAPTGNYPALSGTREPTAKNPVGISFW
jgi:hypothetical protein